MKDKKLSIILVIICLLNIIINVKSNLIFNSLTLIASIVLVYFTYSKKNNFFYLLLLGLILLLTNSILVYFSTLIYSIYLICKINKTDCNLKQCLKDNTVLCVSILIVYGFGVALCGNYLFKIIDEFVLGKEFICESLSLITVLLLCFAIDKKSIFFKSNEKIFKSLLIAAPIFLTSIIVLISQIFYGLSNSKNVASIKDIILICLLYLVLGFFEEILVRGITLDSLLAKYSKTKYGIYFSIIFSSFIFGIMHFINLSFGSNIYSVIVQIIFGFIFGIYLGALYTRTRNIYACSIIHGLWDLSTAIAIIFNLNMSKLNQVSSINIGSLIIYLPIVLLGLFLIRKNKINEIISKENNEKFIKTKEKFIVIIGRILLLVILTILCFLIGSNTNIIIR